MNRKLLSLFLLFTVFASIVHATEASASLNSQASQAALQKLLQNYIGYYTKDTLPQWKELFHPSASIFFPAEDGTVNVRDVEQFFTRQKTFFAEKQSVSEKLENVHVDEGRKIARVTADYIFIADGLEKRGKLGLHLVEGKEGWKIVNLVFSYNLP